MIIATIKDIKIEQVNVNNVSVKSRLQEIIYIKSLFNISIRLESTLRLFQSLYSLK